MWNIKNINLVEVEMNHKCFVHSESLIIESDFHCDFVSQNLDCVNYQVNVQEDLEVSVKETSSVILTIS